MKGTIITTGFTLIAFAANSLLCRMALGDDGIDPASFTAIRLTSGAAALFLLSRFSLERNKPEKTNGSWLSGLSLFVYAAAFSIAYRSLATGTGALILFGSVQLTMLGAALQSGDRLAPVQLAGLASAVVGLVYLMIPGLSAPDPMGALLMGTAGIAWGIYSVRGRGVSTPIFMTTGNFTRTVPMTCLLCAVAFPTIHLQAKGIFLALISGVVTSGLGYVLWYKALRRLTTTQASVLQLLVPVLAAFGGILFLSETVTARLIAASVFVLGGVAMAAVKRPVRVDRIPGEESHHRL